RSVAHARSSRQVATYTRVVASTQRAVTELGSSARSLTAVTAARLPATRITATRIHSDSHHPLGRITATHIIGWAGAVERACQSWKPTPWSASGTPLLTRRAPEDV